MPVMPSEQEKHGHVEGQVVPAQIELRDFILKLHQRKTVALTELDEIDEVGLIGIQSRPNELAGRKIGVEHAAEPLDPFADRQLLVHRGIGGGPIVSNSETALELPMASNHKISAGTVHPA